MTEGPGNIQEATTAEDHTSTENGSVLETDLNEPSPALCLIIIQSLIGSVTVIGNVLLMRIVYDLSNSKLRDSTRLLICYVSASHCILSLVVMARLVKLPCSLFLAGTSNGGINVLSGMLHLAFETFIIVKKPYDHQRFVSLKICRIKIAISCFIALCINVGGYITMKKPHDSSFCYLTNGQFNAPRLALYFSFFTIMIVATSTMQICTLRELNRVQPISRQNAYNTVSSVQIINLSVPGQVVSGNAQIRTVPKSPLHKLTIILSASFLCFLICFMPSVICNVVFIVCSLLKVQISMKGQISTALSTLLQINGSLYVLVYILMSTQIRQGLKAYIKSWLCLCHL